MWFLWACHCEPYATAFEVNINAVFVNCYTDTLHNGVHIHIDFFSFLCVSLNLLNPET